MALDALDRIEGEGAYANLLLPRLLAESGLAERDRAFVTDLVYGTTRRRRACDAVVDRYLARPPSARVRNALRLGAYQLLFGDVAPHAAVGETVAVAPRPARGLVNAVLRRVAEAVSAGIDWPDEATRLSVPDWVHDRLVADLGPERALAALEAMDQPATVSARPDGYVQDPASQQVAAAVGARPGDRVLDACAAPGGKATALARAGAWVAAADVRIGRLGLVQANAARLLGPAEVDPGTGGGTGTGAGSGGPTGRDQPTRGERRAPPARSEDAGDAPSRGAGPLLDALGDEAAARRRGGSATPAGRDAPEPTLVGDRPTAAPPVSGDLVVVAADGTRPPWRPGAFDRVLVDAPCSGLGTLRRRPDLRWRVEAAAVARLAELQRRLVGAAVPLLRPGGVLAYSVCTLTAAESLGVDAWLGAEHPELVPLDPPGEPWEPWGRGAILLPQSVGTDGMCLFRYRVP